MIRFASPPMNLLYGHDPLEQGEGFGAALLTGLTTSEWNRLIFFYKAAALQQVSDLTLSGFNFFLFVNDLR